MRTILAGSRSCNDPRDMDDAIQFSGFFISSVLYGCAKGADVLGWYWACNHKIPVTPYPAEWERYGRSAGFRRNAQMAANADALIALWDGKSHGTKHMIDIATTVGLKVFVYECGRLDS